MLGLCPWGRACSRCSGCKGAPRYETKKWSLAWRAQVPRKDFGTPNTLYTNCSKRKPRDGNLVQGYGVFGTGFGKGSSVQKWLGSRVAEGNMFTKLKKQIINALISVFLFIRVLLSIPYACGLNYS